MKGMQKWNVIHKPLVQLIRKLAHRQNYTKIQYENDELCIYIFSFTLS